MSMVERWNQSLLRYSKLYTANTRLQKYSIVCGSFSSATTWRIIGKTTTQTENFCSGFTFVIGGEGVIFKSHFSQTFIVYNQRKAKLVKQQYKKTHSYTVCLQASRRAKYATWHGNKVRHRLHIP